MSNVIGITNVSAAKLYKLRANIAINVETFVGFSFYECVRCTSVRHLFLDSMTIVIGAAKTGARGAMPANSLIPSKCAPLSQKRPNFQIVYI